MDLNRATLLGRLTRDPEVKTTPTGKTVANMGIATGRVWKDAAGNKQEKTDFHNCVLWGRIGEIAGQYLSKGRKVYVEGRIETRDWVGQDGVKKYRTEIIVDNLIMLDGPRQASPGGLRPVNSDMGSMDDSSLPGAAAGGAVEVVEEEIKVEDIPF
jgi:single-strand DNA-binding protein